MSTQSWSGRDWYERDNVLVESKYKNRRSQYIHRSAKEFLDLETTKSMFPRSETINFNPKAALLWSAIERIRIYEPEPEKPMVDRSTKADLLCLADSAMLLAHALQDESVSHHVQLLEQLDINMQLKQPDREVSWVIEPMYRIHAYHRRYKQPYNTVRIPRPITPANEQGEAYEIQSAYVTPEFVNLNPQFQDDFLSLAIVYGLSDYMKTKLS